MSVVGSGGGSATERLGRLLSIRADHARLVRGKELADRRMSRLLR